MILKVVIDSEPLHLEIQQDMLTQADDFFQKMDTDMNRGWQMSFTWVENPNPLQRCQIAADKLYGAYETENQDLMKMMAAYMLYKLPNITEVYISTNGNMHETEIVVP